MLLLYIETVYGLLLTRGFNYELITLCTCTGQLHVATSAMHVPTNMLPLCRFENYFDSKEGLHVNYIRMALLECKRYILDIE